jgi:uncharacterized protein YcbX
VPVTVSQLAIAPVKGMRLHGTSEIQIGQHGVTGDREFLVIAKDGKLLLTGQTPALLQIEPAWDRARNVLALRFPDGNVVQDTPEPGASAATRMYDGREIPGWVIPGPLSAALSGYLGQEVHLFRREPEHIGHDDQPVTLVSEASLTALAPEFNGTAPDPRRFRMTITMTGTDAWAEHGWGGQKVSIGEATLRVIAPCRAVSSLPGTRTQAPPMRGFCMRWPGCAARTTSPSASGVTSSAPAAFTSVT